MAVPARRTSRAKKKMRRSHIKLNIPNMIECPECGEMKLKHRACPECGTYRGKDVAN